jgi:hypothetical protein
MKREIRDRWTAALRSGEYEQGRSTLRDREDRYCCLGVLCDVLGQDVPQGDYRDPGPSCLYELVHELIGEGMSDLLAAHNDSRRTFEWIAGYIDAHVELEP